MQFKNSLVNLVTFVSTLAVTPVFIPAVLAASDNTSTTLEAPKVAHGKSELKPHIGLYGGYTDGKGSSKAAFSVLGDMGFQPVIPFGAALQIQYTNTSRGTSDDQYLNVLGKGTYNFGGHIPLLEYSYFGAKVGGILNRSYGDDHLRFAVGPTAGFDIPITKAHDFSLGAEGAYLFVAGAGVPDQLSVLGAVKYWF